MRAFISVFLFLFSLVLSRCRVFFFLCSLFLSLSFDLVRPCSLDLFLLLCCRPAYCFPLRLLCPYASFSSILACRFAILYSCFFLVCGLLRPLSSFPALACFRCSCSSLSSVPLALDTSRSGLSCRFVRCAASSVLSSRVSLRFSFLPFILRFPWPCVVSASRSSAVLVVSYMMHRFVSLLFCLAAIPASCLFLVVLTRLDPSSPLSSSFLSFLHLLSFQQPDNRPHTKA